MPELQSVSDSDLQQRVTKLARVVRTTTNALLAHQARLMLESLYEEQQRRSQALMETELSSNRNLSSVIDIS
jgi:hypothetical protein